MKELYDNYYEESFSQSKSQKLNIETFRFVARKYHWNYQRFFADLPKDIPILDFGCGLGQFLFFLKNSGFTNIIGIDMAESQIELAKQIQPTLNFEYVPDSIKWLQENINRFGVIVMNDVLEHVPLDGLIPTMQAIHIALYSNGRVIIKTVNANYPLGSAGRYMDLTHTTAFTEKSLKQLLQHCRFKNVTCYQEEIGIYNPLFFFKKIMVYCTRGLLRSMIYFSESDWPKIISTNIISFAKKP